MANFARFLGASIVLVMVFGFHVSHAYSGDATWYNPSAGTTACGTNHGDEEMIAALPFHWWKTSNPNNDPMCRKRARVTNPNNGKSVTVNIRDKCGGCKTYDIDLSLGAFRKINDPNVGRFKVNWDFV